MTTQNDHTCYVKHVLIPFYVFFTIFGHRVPEGVSQGTGTHNLLMPFSTLGNSKMEISETDFFNLLTIHNDQISYVKHVLDTLYVFFTLFGCLDRGKGLGHNLLMQFSTLGNSKMEIF